MDRTCLRIPKGHVWDKCGPYVGQTGKVTKSGYFTKCRSSFCSMACVRVWSLCTINLHSIESNRGSLLVKRF